MLVVVLDANEQVDEIFKPSRILLDLCFGDFWVNFEDAPFEECDAEVECSDGQADEHEADEEGDGPNIDSDPEFFQDFIIEGHKGVDEIVDDVVVGD